MRRYQIDRRDGKTEIVEADKYEWIGEVIEFVILPDEHTFRKVVASFPVSGLYMWRDITPSPTASASQNDAEKHE